MNLYLVHVGFYNETWGNNIFENHTNFLVVAENPQDAKAKVKAKDEVKQWRMHIDGIIHIEQVDGYKVQLAEPCGDATIMNTITHRELAPTPTPTK